MQGLNGLIFPSLLAVISVIRTWWAHCTSCILPGQKVWAEHSGCRNIPGLSDGSLSPPQWHSHCRTHSPVHGQCHCCHHHHHHHQCIVIILILIKFSNTILVHVIINVLMHHFHLMFSNVLIHHHHLQATCPYPSSSPTCPYPSSSTCP